MGSRSDLDRNEISRPSLGFDPRTVQPVATALCAEEVGLQKRAEEAAHPSASRVLAVFLQAHSATVFGLFTTASLFSTDSNYPFAM